MSSWLDPTPVKRGRSLEAVRRSPLADFAGYGYASHSRFFSGMRLHLAAAPDGAPSGWALTAADRPERLGACRRRSPRARGRARALAPGAQS